MIDWGEIIEICSDLNDPQIKRAKGVLKYKGVPAGKVDSIKDADDLAALLLSHFPRAELKNVIFEILEIINCENLIEKYRGILSDPSQKVNGGATSLTTESATSSNTSEPVLLADTYRYPKLMRTQQRALVKGATTSSKTEISATRSNTGVPVSAADKHPELLCTECKSKVVSAASSDTGVTVSLAMALCKECKIKVDRATSLTTEISAPIRAPEWPSTTETSAATCSSNTWAPVSAANVHPTPSSAEWQAHELNPLRILYLELSKQLNSQEVRTIKLLLSGQYISYQEAEIMDTVEIFVCLEKKGYISSEDLSLLINLLQKIDRKPLIALVHRHYQSIKNYSKQL